ncbi:MAG: DUF2975 domain-containing protein [Clostridia bacterium]|nr:DUF2975 domain-containing protein [Clostridia bacterium]
MLKISRKHSVTLSLVIAGLFLAMLIACAVVLPQIVTPLVTYANQSGLLPALLPATVIPVLVLAYLVVATMALADILLVRLLLHVRGEEVFTAKAVSLIRGISWCCFLLCLWFTVVGIWFQLSFVVAVAAVFLGLCLRVVKNVIEQAIVIKEENDFTV